MAPTGTRAGSRQRNPPVSPADAALREALGERQATEQQEPKGVPHGRLDTAWLYVSPHSLHRALPLQGVEKKPKRKRAEEGAELSGGEAGQGLAQSIGTGVGTPPPPQPSTTASPTGTSRGRPKPCTPGPCSGNT
ncbi:hypothetical protein WJX74_010169 [Apatococcus lobatus]|uniref:Uncharacterized protein n=1 Tax=Apatococcus lobatus TaxID=904363 RepID=A0AAW1Q579_9CHLO